MFSRLPKDRISRLTLAFNQNNKVSKQRLVGETGSSNNYQALPHQAATPVREASNLNDHLCFEAKPTSEKASIYQNEEERLLNKPKRQAVPNPELEADMDQYRVKIEKKLQQSGFQHGYVFPRTTHEFENKV